MPEARSKSTPLQEAQDALCLSLALPSDMHSGPCCQTRSAWNGAWSPHPHPLLVKDHHLPRPRSLRMLWAIKVREGRGRKRGSQLTHPDGNTCSVTFIWEWRVGWPLNKEPGEAVAEPVSEVQMGNLGL